MIINKTIFKTLSLLLTCFTILLFQNSSYAQTNAVGQIDLELALILHPKMSLFDFKRLGFYKVNLDLSDKDFYKYINNLRRNTPDRSNELNIIKNNIKDLKIKSRNIYAKNRKQNSINENDYKEINNQIHKLEEKLADIEFDSKNYEITNIEETRKILSSIKKEVFEVIDDIAREKDLAVVLNNPVNHFNNDFPIEYENRIAFSQKHTNMYSEIYFQFLLGAELSKNDYTLPSSAYLSNWLEMSRNPEMINALPSTPQPFVFIGAKDILLDVLKKIYSKYNCPVEAYENIKEAVVIIKSEETSAFLKGYK